jgi:predicted lipoprotein with Yx(FWY)xxD motif
MKTVLATIAETIALAATLMACEHGPTAPSWTEGEGTEQEENSSVGVEGNGGYPTGGASSSSSSGSAASSTDITLIDDDQGGQYLADSRGRALYLFANDTPGRLDSACTGDCLQKWPAFDVNDVSVEDGLLETDFERFQREDGRWQTAFKGRPLYYFAMDGASGEMSGDGLGNRWFVARDYLAFLAASAAVTPEGASEPTPFLTNRAGRTAYIFLKDQAGFDGDDPDSACDATCISAWPVWAAPNPLGEVVVPSSMRAADFGWFERDEGGRQLSYRGFPLYYFAQDELPGSVTGHRNGAWRAIDPILFATPIAD